MIDLKLNWLSYALDVTYQPLDHSKCGKTCDTDSYKELIFKPKASSFHATEFSYINFIPQEIDQILGFWAGQSLKLRRNTCFRRFKSSLVVNFHVPKPERLDLSKMWTLIFFLLKGAHMTTTSGQSAWGIWI